MNPLVSVVVPTHNRRPLLEEAIESVRAQRDVTLEIIVVDDASTDDTWGWLSTQRDLKCLHHDRNARQATARNTGFAVATGKYVMFLDDDDILVPRALSILSRALDDEPGAVAAAGARWDWFVDEARGRRDAHPRVKTVKNVFDEFLFGWSAIPSQSLFRSDVVRSVNGFDETLWPVEDRDLWLRVARKGPAVLVPDVVVQYRVLRGHTLPADIVQRREFVAQKAITSLPPDQKPRAIRLRWAGVSLNTADENLRSRNYLKGIANIIKGLIAWPLVFANPLLLSWSSRRIVRGAMRSVIPPRYIREDNKATSRVRGAARM